LLRLKITTLKYLFQALSLLIIVLNLQCKKESVPVNDHTSYVVCDEVITDWDGLLQDSLLITTAIPSVPEIDTNYLNWINDRYNRIDIRSLTSENFSDLQCLKYYLMNKDLVALGESCHGTKQYSQIKVRLIKFLHEEMGFDVIAFESGLYECFYTNENIQELSGLDAIKNSIFYYVWGTPDVLDLFD